MVGYPRYRRRKSYALAIIIILLAVFVSFSALKDLFGLRSLVISAFYPLQFATTSVWQGITGIPASINGLRRLSQENSELKVELKDIKPKLLVLAGLEKENNRLRRVLGFKQYNWYGRRLLAARVVGKAPSPWFSILTINKGSRAGVQIDLPVVDKDGLVGRVVEVTAFSAKVLLILDAESSVAAVNAVSRDFGVAAGSTSNKLSLKYVSAGAQIEPGDKIITSQLSTIFPAGIPIGTVARARKGEHDLFYHIELKPAVDFSKLEEVFLVL
ncbi:rod shape-determining protein MreC [Candidatus Margulisiibacteriota bacterium]